MSLIFVALASRPRTQYNFVSWKRTGDALLQCTRRLGSRHRFVLGPSGFASHPLGFLWNGLSFPAVWPRPSASATPWAFSLLQVFHLYRRSCLDRFFACINVLASTGFSPVAGGAPTWVSQGGCRSLAALSPFLAFPYFIALPSCSHFTFEQAHAVN